MKVSFEGIGESVITFYNNEESGAAAGVPVKMSGNGEISACGEGERFFGVSLACEEDFAAVQVGGYAELSYSGSETPAVGYARLEAVGAGGVRVAAANGGEFLVVDVDSANKIIGIML